MYEGNNPTALNSREWLVNALLSLMEEIPYSKITIRNICTKADLSRQTFYNFFQSKDDIIRFCIQQCYTQMSEHLSAKPSLQLIHITEQMAITFKENQNLIKLLIAHGLDSLLEAEIAAAIHLFARQVNTESTNSMFEYGNAFLIGAISHTVLYWFKDDTPISAKQLSELLFKILSGDYFCLK